LSVAALAKDNYEPDCSACMKLSLRRTLVLVILLSTAFLNAQVSDTTGDDTKDKSS